jgi:6-pyruvoyltetrahydropterin/6-carboxytetrahydropterin synthase
MSAARPGRDGQVTLTRVYHFSAGHRLESPHLGSRENVQIYGACHRAHGHNYYLEVSVRGRPDPVTGMAADLRALDDVVTRQVLDRVDHQDLDRTVPELAGLISTGENLARAFWGLLAPHVPALDRVAVVETAKNRFEWRQAGGEFR